MATFDSVSPQQTVTTNDKFIPEIWSDEIIATYEQNLVLADKVRKLSMKGKKGDTIHVPKPGRDDASAKVAETAVTLIADTATELVISIDQHFEYSRMIEDITDVQSLPSARRFYTEDAGYALARNVDSALFALGTGVGDGAGGSAATPASWEHSNCLRSDGTTGYEAWAEDTTLAADVFNDALFRAALQLLDDSDVPMSSRCLVIAPSAVNTIRGIDRYNSVDFVNNKGVANGEIGNVYGVPVYVSTNVSTIETAAQNSGDTSIASRGNVLMHKDAYVLAEQVGVRSQTQYKQEHLSTLFTSDRLYGKSVYRPESAVIIATAE